jgi:hypothetical protein
MRSLERLSKTAIIVAMPGGALASKAPNRDRDNRGWPRWWGRFGITVALDGDLPLNGVAMQLPPKS